MTTTTTPEPEATYLGPTFSSLCSLLGRPLIMTGILRDILVRHFLSASQIEEPDLRKLVWQPGESTGILIESVYRWRPELTEHRPAVLIKRNAYQNMRLSIGDQQLGLTIDQFGHEHFATFWVGSHTLFCLNGTGASTELLAEEVRRELTQFAPAIIRSTGLARLQVTQVGAATELEESQENWVVPITIGYGYEERWKLLQHAPRLKQISLSLLVEL